MAAEVNCEVIDFQLVAENVGFLDGCFDNSFVLQNSLIAVKEYIAEEHNELSSTRLAETLPKKKVNTSLRSKTLPLDSNSSTKADQVSQGINGKVISNNLEDWGLPLQIIRKYKQRHISQMFDWQVACLGNSKVLIDGCNLVYSAPTSAGKSLVAEILTIKTVLERQKKVIIILPFVSIVREKMFYLQDILSSSGIRVEGFMGAQSPPGGLQAVHIAICTIEKANSLVNRLLDEGTISELGAVIVDELHLLGDPHRGYILELLLTKIKYVSQKLENVQIQVVGMSATLPNLDMLANWLEAELFITQFRPIPLDEFCLIGNKLYDKHGKKVNTIDDAITGNDDSDNVLKICLKTIEDECSILIFCMTKNRCENLAQSIASSFYKLGCTGCEMGLILRKQLSTERISEVLEQLTNCPVGLDQVIKNSISFGVAYHHAGLTFDERDIIEGGFKSGAIRVLVATSTLSSGVNLPARKVIIRSPMFQRQPINKLTYKQMIGRAGRMGKDIKGESILICTEAEKNIGFDLMMGALDPVNSCIESEDKYMRAVLEMIASQVACSKDELDLYSRCTLLSTQQISMSTQNFLLENTLEELKNFELIRVQSDGDETKYVASPLGKACLSSSMAPNDGLSLFCELQKARQCLVLETDLHLIYLVTPYSVSSQWADMDWLHLLTLWESLTKAMKRVGELVGVQESFIIRCLRGANKQNIVQNKLNIHKRFYTALALQDLVNEVPLSDVAAKFQCARGFLQGLQQAAATFAGMVTAFCRQLGWKNMEMLISQFQDRLHFGIHSELIELMKLPSLNGMRARTIFDAGFETISNIASANAYLIETALRKAVPFQSEKKRADDDNADIRKRNKIKNIWITGCCGMTIKEAAENLINEARKYLEHEIGVTEIKWISTAANSVIAADEVLVNNNKEEGPINILTDSSHYEISNVNIKQERIIKELHVSPVKSSSVEDKYLNVNINNFTNNVKDEVNTVSKSYLTGQTKVDVTKINNLLTRNNSISTEQTSQYSKLKNETKKHSFVKDVNYIENSPSILRDEIIWESINFTEAAFENITKNRTSDRIFSPNISFGDSEDKTVILESNLTNNTPLSKTTSVKDVSLFSSEGDNSSLFEESLPLDLIPSKLLDEKTQTSTLNKLETDIHFINVNSSTILNAFNKSTLVEVDEDDDMKLVYEDDNKTSLNELEIGFNLSEDIEVIDTQEENERVSTKKLKRHSKLNNTDQSGPPPLAKKAKIVSKSTLRQTCKLKSDIALTEIKLVCEDSKTFTLEINDNKFKCVVLRRKDIFENLFVIENIKDAAIYLDINTMHFTTNAIGTNVIKQTRSVSDTNEINNRKLLVQGVAIYDGFEMCIYLDLMSLEQDFSKIKPKLANWWRRKSMKLKMMSLKLNYASIKKSFDVDMSTDCVDVSLSEWVIDSDERISNIDYLIKKYYDVDLSTVSIKINKRERRIKNLGKIENLCVKAWCVWSVADKQTNYLLEQYPSVENAIGIEIQVSKILADCEYYGLTVDKDLASQLLIDVKNSQEILQKKAYKICGYRFNFNSSKDVAKVLGIYRGRKVSTKKSVLTSHNSPMASIVIFWRKLNSILTKTLYPLTEKACIYSEGNRINPSYTMFTCTGRVSMHEPNLQNVPRTFSVPANYLTESKPCDDLIEFNCRNIFRAAPGWVLVSADYCQLEMRILTHYSEDAVLMRIMKSDVDVFKSIAASWGGMTEDKVDDDLRQKAKQLCYGILYGMGNKTLSQQLDVTEIEASVFMDTFYKTYPAIKLFTQLVVEDCRRKGYVETLMKRRRYLPDINSSVISKKSTAERQAVNTTVQGSAADIAKAAMCAIDNKTSNDPMKPRLILQMHDELIYEVPQNKINTFHKLLKKIMEDTVRLKVPLPVKVRFGYTWGSLKEIKF